MARPKQESKMSLTDTEQLIMNELWKLNSANVKDLLVPLELATGKNYAYTSISTLIRLLEKKGFVRSEKQGRGHIYFPCVSKENHQLKTTNTFIEQVFDGKSNHLIRHLISSDNLNKTELEELKSWVDSQVVNND
ncbi:MAG: BlaI/MecI/CopY family transcriptional regulator [Bdellovibrionales bacterium]